VFLGRTSVDASIARERPICLIHVDGIAPRDAIYEQMFITFAGDNAVSASDHLPENTHYRDDGCEICPKCLDCPLPACRYDLPPKRAGALLREAQLRQLLAQGLSADDAARQMGVSRRTVFRLKRYAATTATIPLLVR
jgi:hypothetical protein